MPALTISQNNVKKKHDRRNKKQMLTRNYDCKR